MKKELIIVGAGVTAERIYGFIRKHNLYNVVSFAQDKEFIKKDKLFKLPIIDIEAIKKDHNIFVAFGWNKLNSERRDIYSRLHEKGCNFVNVVSPNAQIYGSLSGVNCWVADNVIIESSAVIKSNVMIDHNAYIGTGTVINSHCYVAAGALIAGNCIVGEQCFIGLKSTIFDQTIIGEKSLIGACTIIKRNIEKYTVVKTKSEGNVTITLNDDEIENKLVFYKNVR